MNPKRPFLIWVLCLVFFGLAALYLLQVIQTLLSWNVLLDVQYKPGPWYPLFQGVFLLLGFASAGLLLWLRLDWSASFAAVLTSLAGVWYWLDRLVFSTNPQPLRNSLFALVLFLILFTLVIASLWVIKPNLRSESPASAEEENES
ncbi:MAG: hypothetical protein VB013_05350 [Anaerolineaceae bacterium]|nr:hypothetical protein [Anaerolineaceae bacterium]